MLDSKETQYYTLDYQRPTSKGIFSYFRRRSPSRKALSHAEASSCEAGKKDYYSFNPISGIHTFEIKGQRATQEDRVVNGLLPGFEALDPEKKQHVLKVSLEDIETKIRTEIPDDAQRTGTTAICAAADKDGITFGNIGDSTLYVVITDANHKFKDFRRLNTLHQPDDPAENERLMNMGCKLYRSGKHLMRRLNDKEISILAMSRSLGDEHLIGYGLSHEPEVQFVSYESLGMVSGDKIFMVTACDGLKDCLGQSDSEIVSQVEVGLQFKKFFNGENKDLSELMITLAKASDEVQSQANAGAKDNVSVSVVEVGQSDQPSAVMMAVFDGHGGSAVSEYCRVHYPKNLEKTLKAELDYQHPSEDNPKPKAP